MFSSAKLHLPGIHTSPTGFVLALRSVANIISTAPVAYCSRAAALRHSGNYRGTSRMLVHNAEAESIPQILAAPALVYALARADRISLRAEFLFTLNPFLHGFRFSSTILKTIELIVTTSVGECFTSKDDDVPLGLLLHNFPSLECISLRDCLVNWEPPPLPSYSLRFMEILMDIRRDLRTADSADFDNAKSASGFLRSTPVLEILTLVYRFPGQYHED